MRHCVALPDDLVAQIDRMVGEERREWFVIDAIKRQIRAEQEEALAAVAGSLTDPVIPEWKTPETAYEWVRRQRRGEGPFPPASDPG